MKKFYLIPFFIFAFLLAGFSQTFNCKSGTTITINSFILTQERSGCTISYDITIVTGEPGIYQAKIANAVAFTVDVSSPGSSNFQGTAFSVMPCISLTRFHPLRIVSPTREICLVSLLPVELLSFSARKDDHDALLNWVTASESNNEGFVVEHSRNGEDWSEVTFITGNGTTSLQHEYNYRMSNLPSGDHYFRLKQMDFDGAAVYSPVAHLNMDGPQRRGALLFPNPLVSGQALGVNGNFDRAVIRTSTGQMLLSLPLNDLARFRTLDLPAGMYLITLSNDTEIITERLIVQD